MTHLHEIERARLQEAVNQAWRHFITEEKPPGIDPSAAHPSSPISLPCVFQAPSGDRCAIGILMPSDEQAPHLLRHSGGIGELFTDTLDTEDNIHYDMDHELTEAEQAWLLKWAPLRGYLESLQSCHDLAVQANRYQDDGVLAVALVDFRVSLAERLTEFCEMNDLTVPST